VKRLLICGTAGVLLAAACSGDDGPWETFSLPDPVGDTLIIPGASSTPRAIDAVGVGGHIEGSALMLTVRFAEPISPFSDSAANSVFGIIDLDIDENPSTGREESVVEAFNSSVRLGVDYRLVLEDIDGTVGLYDLRRGSISEIEASYFTHGVTVRVPFQALGYDDGRFQMAGIIGTLSRPTDVFPNNGGYTVRPRVGGGGRLPVQ
jgi:hypothetical protein